MNDGLREMGCGDRSDGGLWLSPDFSLFSEHPRLSKMEALLRARPQTMDSSAYSFPSLSSCCLSGQEEIFGSCRWGVGRKGTLGPKGGNRGTKR